MSVGLNDTILAVLEVEAKKPCEGSFKSLGGVEAQALDICGARRTCRPCVARAFISEAESIYLRR